MKLTKVQRGRLISVSDKIETAYRDSPSIRTDGDISVRISRAEVNALMRIISHELYMKEE